MRLPTWGIAVVIVFALAVVESAKVAAWLVIAALYLAPSIVAGLRVHHQRGAIFVVNLFLGWTFVGWVVALAMACSAVKTPAEA